MDREPRSFFFDRRVFADAPSRTLVYGIAGSRVREVVAAIDGERLRARPSQRGSFLFVLDGTLPAARIRVRPVYAEPPE